MTRHDVRQSRLGGLHSVRTAVGMLSLTVLVLLSATPMAAQESGLADRCREETADGTALRACNLVAQAVASVQSPLGVVASGGNPVPGTASTLGMRLGSTPRVSLTGRFTAARARVPEIREFGARGTDAFFMPSLNLDAAVGVTQGFSPLPTVGGLGSIDLLGSAGVTFVPRGSGWADGSTLSWALGTRLGVLRESFTLPGVSASLMYRKVGSVAFGDRSLNAEDAYFDLDVRSWSLRGVVGKRILGANLSGGIGYDWYSSGTKWGLLDPSGGPEIHATYNGFDTRRTLAFANLSYTFLVFHIVGELGWQSGPKLLPDPLPTTEYRAPKGTIFGGLSGRLSI